MNRNRALGVLTLVAAVAACEPRSDLFEGVPQPTTPTVVDAGAIAYDSAAARANTERAPSPRGVRYDVPADWDARPPSSSMRVAEWGLPGAAECALFTFPGGGSVDANFERWLGQFTQPDGRSSTDVARRMSMDVRGFEVQFLQVTGTFHASNAMMNGPGETLPDHALIGAVFPTQPAPYFLKCTGPRGAIADQAEVLTEFISSFVFE